MSEAVEAVESGEEAILERISRQLEPAPKAAPQPPVKEAPAQEAPIEASEPAAEPDNLIEVDFKGGKYKLPSELKELHEGYLRQEDYTRKTQEVAERQKVLDLHEQQASAQRALQQAVQPFLERLVTLNNQLSQFANVDWAAYSDQDPQAANKHWMQYQSLKERKGTLEHEMQGASTQHLNKLREAADNLRKENSKILSEKVKGWNPERETSVRDFAKKTYGFSDQELVNVFDARLMRLMNDAKDLHDLRAAKPVRQAAPAQATLKPGASEPQSTAKAKQAELRKAVRTAKTDESKGRAIQALLENRF